MITAIPYWLFFDHRKLGNVSVQMRPTTGAWQPDLAMVARPPQIVFA
jgi:hypothetical protein